MRLTCLILINMVIVLLLFALEIINAAVAVTIYVVLVTLAFCYDYNAEYWAEEDRDDDLF